MRDNVIKFGKSLLATMALVQCTSMAAFADAPWSHDFNGSMSKAKAEHKYVLADVYTDWCGWCKKLDATTFKDAGLNSYLDSKFVCVKLNAEDKGDGTKESQKNGVDGFPTALVYDDKGACVGKVVGFKDAEGYKSALEQIVNKH